MTGSETGSSSDQTRIALAFGKRVLMSPVRVGSPSFTLAVVLLVVDGFDIVYLRFDPGIWLLCGISSLMIPAVTHVSRDCLPKTKCLDGGHLKLRERQLEETAPLSDVPTTWFYVESAGWFCSEANNCYNERFESGNYRGPVLESIKNPREVAA